MTVAELEPINLFTLIISGTAIGVYAPMIFWRHCQQHWHEWPVQTRVWVWFVGILFVGAVWVSTLYII